MNKRQALKHIKNGGEYVFRPCWMACAAPNLIGVGISLFLLLSTVAGAAFAIAIGKFVLSGGAMILGFVAASAAESVKSINPTSVNYLLFGSILAMEGVSMLITRYSSEYKLTDSVIFVSEGLFATDTMSAPINQGILPTTSQTILGKLLNYGDIAITVNTDSVATDTEAYFTNVESPDEFVELLEAVSRLKHRSRRDNIGEEA